MNFIDIVRTVSDNSHHKYDSINKIKIQIMEEAKLDRHEYICNYNSIDKEIIKELRESGFMISLNSGWHTAYYIIKW